MIFFADFKERMEPIKNALNQAGHLVQQAAHSVAEVLHISETTTYDVRWVSSFRWKFFLFFLHTLYFCHRVLKSRTTKTEKQRSTLIVNKNHHHELMKINRKKYLY